MNVTEMRISVDGTSDHRHNVSLQRVPERFLATELQTQKIGNLIIFSVCSRECKKNSCRKDKGLGCTKLLEFAGQNKSAMSLVSKLQ